MRPLPPFKTLEKDKTRLKLSEMTMKSSLLSSMLTRRSIQPTKTERWSATNIKGKDLREKEDYKKRETISLESLLSSSRRVNGKLKKEST